MNESEANEMKEQIFAQLDEFDEYAAFRFSFDCLLVINIFYQFSVAPLLQYNVSASYVLSRNSTTPL